MKIGRSAVAYETPLSELVHAHTPNASFFVRNHAVAVPAISPQRYTLELAGASGTHTLRLDDLRALPRVSETITLACAGNGRTAFVPPTGGVPWGFGAVGTARWEGVRLRDLLALAGIVPNAAHVVFDGYDAAPDENRPPYRRSIPLARALAGGTIVADTMNGAPLPAEHGGPLRLVVAGWTANHSVKWLARIAPSVAADECHWMVKDYRVPGPSGSLEMLEACAPIALVVSPQDGTTCGPDVVLHGIAYGEPAPHAVRVDVDGTVAGDAPVAYADGPYAWGRWSFPLRLGAGPRQIRVRPVDAQGDPGPLHATWNARGYRYDGPHAVTVDVV